MKVKAAVVYEPNTPYVIEELDLAAPKANEVLVKIAACGVCHTDEGAKSGGLPSTMPVVLGHEGCGVVIEVGPDVTEYAPGDRVGFSYSSCGCCDNCLTGQPYDCEHFGELNFIGGHYDGTRRFSKDGQPVSNFFGQGAFSTHAVIHVHNLYKVPEDIDLKLCGPLGCGIQTGAGAVLNYLKPEIGTSIVVAGCGGVGLSAIMAAKLAGCTKIIAVDMIDSRLETALELGATHAFNPKNCDVIASVKEVCDGKGSHYAVDTSGNGKCVLQSLRCTRTLGVCVVVGATDEMTLHCDMDLMGSGKTLVGLVEGNSIPKVFIPRLIECYKQGKFPFDKLIKFYDFEDINQAREDSLTGKTIKPILIMDPDLK